MKKILAFVLALALVFTLFACGSEDKPSKPSESIKTEATEPKEAEDNSDDNDYVYVPEKDIPEGLPVYPGAVMAFDTEVWSFNEGLHWMWMYEEAGSGKEILEFFLTELEKLGFEFEDTFADDYEVFLHDVTETVSLGYSADENDDLSRLGYMITVNLDAWDNR